MKKAIIYGHKLDSHTQSYVHYGFKKAFGRLGYETLWVDKNDDISNINSDNCIFLTEGQVDENIPLNKNAKYILHNCNQKKYADIPNKINIQIFHNFINYPSDYISPVQHPTFSTTNKIEKINNYTAFGGGILFQPWATDLLPNEIDLNIAQNIIDNRECVFLGTFGDAISSYQNYHQINPFFEECIKNNIKVNRIDPWANPVSFDENRRLVNNSFLSPSLQGIWQVNMGYTPCRLFKNISYGHMGITNNYYSNLLFDNKLIYDEDPINLFYKALEKKQDPNLVNEIKDLMQEVKSKHTYLHRLNQILALF